MTTPPVDPAAFQAFLAQLAAQQGTTPAAGIPVTPAAPVAELEPTVDVDISDVLGGSAYGPNLLDKNDPIGTTFTGTLAQKVTAKQDRDFKTKQPKFYDDGKTPVPFLTVALDVPVSERHPDGRATWYARGKDIRELDRAAVEAGVPREVIKAGLDIGAILTIKYERDQVNPQYPASNPAKIRSVTYTRPGQPATQAAPVAAPAVAPVQAVAPVTAPVAPAAGPARPEGLTDAQYAVFLKALGQAA